MSNEVYQLDSGDALTIGPIQLFDDQGVAITAYNGSQDLKVTVWPGGTRAPSFTFTNGNASWLAVSPNPNTLQIVLTPTQTATLIPGRYKLKLEINDAGSLVNAYGCSLEVGVVPGTDTQPPTYPYDPSEAYQLLLEYGRSWLTQLETGFDETGFAKQMGRARTKFEDAIHAHWRVASMVMVVGGQAFGPRRSGARSEWLIQQLAADTLIYYDWVGEACAYYALYFICRGQLDGDPKNKYARLGRYYKSEAEAIILSHAAELSTSGSGFADVTIDMTCTDPMSA